MIWSFLITTGERNLKEACFPFSFHNIFNTELFSSLTYHQQNFLLVQTPAVSQ